MNQFYLNECLGNVQYGCSDLAAGMIKVVHSFSHLARVQKLYINKGWILEKDPAKMMLGGIALHDIVKNMQDRECRRLFFVYCVHHPINLFFTQSDDDTLLMAEYKFEQADATNIAIAAHNNGILLSLPVSDKLKNDTLTIYSEQDEYEPITVANLHGDTIHNENAIERILLDRNYLVSNGIEKLSCLAPNVYFSDVFRERFDQLTTNDKKSIFSRLDEARRGNLLQPLVCNGTVIKHVAPHVAELRIVNPVDIRVYFHEFGDSLFFANLALKSEYVGRNDQDNDIKFAESIVIEMMG